MASGPLFSADEIGAYSLACHDSLELLPTAYVIANETRRLLSCDRVSVLVLQRGAMQILAVSGQKSVNAQSEVIDNLKAVAQAAYRNRVWPDVPTTKDDAPPDLIRAIQSYLDVSNVRTLSCVPLVERPAEHDDAAIVKAESMGCLVAESFADTANIIDLRARLSVLADHAASAIQNVLTHRHIFLLPIWTAMGRWRSVAALRNRPIAAVFLAVLSLLLIGIFFSVPFRLAADGFAEPKTTRRVFAAEDGVIDSLRVRHGDRVLHGEPLATVRSPELDLRLEQVNGEIATAEKRLEAIRSLLVGGGGTDTAGRSDRNRFAAEAEELRVTLDSLRKQHALLVKRLEGLTSQSPITGQVTTWDVEATLTGRPVTRGQPLLTVADVNGPWHVEIRLPANRYQHLVEAQQRLNPSLDVIMVAKADPSREVHGRTALVASTIRDSERDGPYLSVVAEFVDSRPPEWRPGTELEVRIECGRRSIGFVYFHEFFEFVQSRLLF